MIGAGYKVAEQILNICMNYANYVKGGRQHSGAISAERV